MSDGQLPPDGTPTPSKHRNTRDPELWFNRPMEKYRRRHGVDFKPNLPFFELADPVVESKRTLLGYPRLYVFWQVVSNVIDVPGIVAEIGSFRGGSAYFIASVFKALRSEEVPMHVFDTFAGHPGGAISEHDPFHQAGQFELTSVDDVRQYLSPFREVAVHQGDILDALPALPDATYRLVHIDTDLYKPTLACLDHFGPRMSPGGAIVIDDYGQKKCPGVPQAVSEFMERTELQFQAWDLRTEQLVLIRR